MDFESLGALGLFALIASITPGPNNIMLMTSGTHFGFRKTIPHILGVNLGFCWMVFLVGIGLTQLFKTYPLTQNLLRICSVLYLLYLAFKIASSPTSTDATVVKPKPMTFLQAVLFQWVNPKAWSMALTAHSVYADSNSLANVSTVTAVFFICNLPSICVWVILGKRIRRLLINSTRLRAFNVLMAGLLVGSLCLTM